MERTKVIRLLIATAVVGCCLGSFFGGYFIGFWQGMHNHDLNQTDWKEFHPELPQ